MTAMSRKATDKYFFTVEGETEKWYLDWLCRQINADERAVRHVAFNVKVEKNPLKRAKSLSILDKVSICHVFDFESEDEVHTGQFRKTLERMKAANELGRDVHYVNGYSNLTFELWILLHKKDARRPLNHRRDYLQLMNKAFGERFEDLKQLKHEGNFKKVLSKLSIDDVIEATSRAKAIAAANKTECRRFAEWSGYRYCLENPATELWRTVEEILKNSGLMA